MLKMPVETNSVTTNNDESTYRENALQLHKIYVLVGIYKTFKNSEQLNRFS